MDFKEFYYYLSKIYYLIKFIKSLLKLQLNSSKRMLFHILCDFRDKF